MFLDNDDLLFAEHVELLVDRLTSNPDVVAAYAFGWDTRTKFSGEKYQEVSHEVPPAHRLPFSREQLMTMNFIPIQCVLFQRELYEMFGGFDEELDYLEDWNLWSRYAAGGDFLCVPKLTSLYRTPASAGERARRQAKLDAAYGAALAKTRQALSLAGSTVAGRTVAADR